MILADVTKIIIETISYIAGITIAISAIPQILLIIKTKSVKDVSLFTALLLTIGDFCWMIYGIYINSWSMIIFDSFGGALYLIVSVLKIIDIIKYKKDNKIAERVEKEFEKDPTTYSIDEVKEMFNLEDDNNAS